MNVFEPVLAKPKFCILASNPAILSADTDPDTIWPPLAATMYPEVLESNVTTALLVVLKVTLEGIICTLLSLYTTTFTFLVSKLWSKLTDVWFVKSLFIVAVWETEILVKFDPFPSKDPENADPDTIHAPKSTIAAAD